MVVVVIGVLWELVASRMVDGVGVDGRVGLGWPKCGCLPARINAVEGIVCIVLPRHDRHLHNRGIWVVTWRWSGNRGGRGICRGCVAGE